MRAAHEKALAGDSPPRPGESEGAGQGKTSGQARVYAKFDDFPQAYGDFWWPVFPLKKGSKTPATRNGFKDATTDPAQIQTMFATPGLNIGIATGAAFWVLDIDGPEGAASLASLEEQHGVLPKSLRQTTRSSGLHILFKAEPGKSSAVKASATARARAGARSSIKRSPSAARASTAS